MNFYNKYFAGNYDELITYYPRYYREVWEMEEILRAHGRIADMLEDGIERVYRDCFIDEADEGMITRLEWFLGIGIKKSQPLEERRRLVKALFIGSGKLSASLLNEMIFAYINKKADIIFSVGDSSGNNRLHIRFDSSADETLYLGELHLLLHKKIPAHIMYILNIQYETSFSFSSIEEIRLLSTEIAVKMYFFKRILNGGWLLDGSVSLGQIPICEIALGVAIGTIQVIQEKKVCFPALDVSAVVPVVPPESRYSMEAGYRFDSSEIPDVGRGDIGITIPVPCTGIVETGSVTVEKDLWHLDGQFQMDGSRILDAEVREERL